MCVILACMAYHCYVELVRYAVCVMHVWYLDTFSLNKNDPVPIATALL